MLLKPGPKLHPDTIGQLPSKKLHMARHIEILRREPRINLYIHITDDNERVFHVIFSCARLIIEAINKPVVGYVINFIGIEPKEVHEWAIFAWIAFGKEDIVWITLAVEAYLERLFKSIP